MLTRFKMHSRKNNFSTSRVFNNFDCLTCVQTPSKLMMLMCLPIIFIMSISETRSIMSLSVWPSFNIFTATMFPWVPVLIKLATSALTTLTKILSCYYYFTLQMHERCLCCHHISKWLSGKRHNWIKLFPFFLNLINWDFFPSKIFYFRINEMFFEFMLWWL